MRYIAAYLLAVQGGNKNPSLDDIGKILGSVGIEVDKQKAEKVISELKGKDVNELITKGSEKLASVHSGGGVAVAANTGSAPGAPAEGKKDTAKKEEKKEESEESDEDMGFGLFD